MDIVNSKELKKFFGMKVSGYILPAIGLSFIAEFLIVYVQGAGLSPELSLLALILIVAIAVGIVFNYFMVIRSVLKKVYLTFKERDNVFTKDEKRVNFFMFAILGLASFAFYLSLDELGLIIFHQAFLFISLASLLFLGGTWVLILDEEDET